MKERLQKLLEQKQLRYISQQFLGDKLYNQLLDETQFLNVFNDIRLAERIWCIINDIFDTPICPYCNTPSRQFIGIKTTPEKYMHTFCSISCSRKYQAIPTPICQNPECNKPVRVHNNNYCSRECFNKCRDNETALNKRKQTCLEKYDVDNVRKIFNTKNKIKQTKLERYNDPNYNNMDQQRKTKLELYGDENYTNSNKGRITRLRRTYKVIFNKFKHIIQPLFNIDEYIGGGYNNIYEWKCIRCNNNFNWWYHNGLIPRCPICDLKPDSYSEPEEILYHYLLGNNFKILKNTRRIIPPLELDIYIPDIKTAIEFDGIYWHSELQGKDKNYHLNKTELCEKKDIRLIHIFEDEWQYKYDIVKSRLNNIFSLTKYKIYARKCIVKEISGKLKYDFIEKYHIQGNDFQSSIYLGLFYKDRLVAVMTFGQLRYQKAKPNYYELYRFVTINNFNIIGGAGKLLKYFERNYNPRCIISYADRRWSQGNLYPQLGFLFLKYSSPSYHYFKPNNILRESRVKYQKHKLEKLLDKYDPKLSEWENMQLNNYNRIWDCGNLVFVKEY